MPSPKFNTVKGKLNAHHPIFAKYNDGTPNATVQRKLCPHVLGYKKDSGGAGETEPNERVLCYQLDGPAPAVGWRCFDLTLLEIEATDPPISDWVTPSNYSKKWQNVVKNAKHSV